MDEIPLLLGSNSPGSTKIEDLDVIVIGAQEAEYGEGIDDAKLKEKLAKKQLYSPIAYFVICSFRNGFAFSAAIPAVLATLKGRASASNMRLMISNEAPIAAFACLRSCSYCCNCSIS